MGNGVSKTSAGQRKTTKSSLAGSSEDKKAERILRLIKANENCEGSTFLASLPQMGMTPVEIARLQVATLALTSGSISRGKAKTGLGAETLERISQGHPSGRATPPKPRPTFAHSHSYDDSPLQLHPGYSSSSEMDSPRKKSRSTDDIAIPPDKKRKTKLEERRGSDQV